MNTLTAIEAERVNQILLHALERLEVLSYLPISWDDDIIQDLKCPPVVNSLEKLWMAEEQLKEIDLAATGASGLKDIAIVKQVHRCSRAACRNFIADTESLKSIRNRPESRCPNFVKFVEYLNKLREQILQRLTTTVEDEANNRALLHDLTERERHFEESRDILMQKVDSLLEESKQINSQLETVSKKLTHELDEISQYNTSRLESIQKEMNDAISKATNDHELRMRQLQDRVDSMERQIYEVIDKNKEDEIRLRKEKIRIEINLNAKISSYDENMSLKTNYYESLKNDFENETKEYNILKEYFDKIDLDLSKESEEDRILLAVKNHSLFASTFLDLAATTIQKIFRGRQARAEVNKMKAKLKKKKGKGKGKGKKK